MPRFEQERRDPMALGEVCTGAGGYATVSLPRDFLDEIEMELDAARRNSTRLALAVRGEPNARQRRPRRPRRQPRREHLDREPVQQRLSRRDDLYNRLRRER